MYRFCVSGKLKSGLSRISLYLTMLFKCVRIKSHARLNSVVRLCLRQNLNASFTTMAYKPSSLLLLRKMSSKLRYVSHKNLNHGVTVSFSVASFSWSS